MPAAARKDIDASAGHACYPPQVPTAGSPTVIIEGHPVVRIGDPYQNHACPLGLPHAPVPVASSGSTSVMADGKFIHRIGDQISCGDLAAAGSPTVFIGG